MMRPGKPSGAGAPAPNRANTSFTPVRSEADLIRCAPLSLQLSLELVEKAPVSALSDELLGARLEHPDLVQAQGIEAQGVLRAVRAPLAIGDVLHDLEGIVVALGIVLVHDERGRPLRLEGADVGRFQDGAEGAFDSHRMRADKLPVPGQHAAEVL